VVKEVLDTVSATMTYLGPGRVEIRGELDFQSGDLVRDALVDAVARRRPQLQVDCASLVQRRVSSSGVW
jgi:hypothetical protein